jgi:hypothetical protein
MIAGYEVVIFFAICLRELLKTRFLMDFLFFNLFCFFFVTAGEFFVRILLFSIEFMVNTLQFCTVSVILPSTG